MNRATQPLDEQQVAGRQLAGAPLLTADQVAELLAVPVSWVREQTRAGRIPHLRLGRYCRYQLPALQAWLDEQAAGPATRERRRG